MNKLDENKQYNKFVIVFNAIITLFALGIIISSIIGWNDMERASLYLILGVIIVLNRLWWIYKIIKAH
ncbi:MAG: DUF2644 domain-containing protein [Virgibacillus proomii]|jgi:hypothetical protein